MKKLENILNMLGSKAFKEAGFDEKLGLIRVSNRPDLCEYQCNGAMAGAKLYHKAPIMIAEAVAEILKDMEYEGIKVFSSVEAVKPGFINMNLSDEIISKYLNDMNQDDNLGVEQVESKKIIVDYGGANVAKPLHVGHLRSAVIGECIKRLARRMGNDVIGDVHLGDWGLQMGLIIAELEERGKLSDELTIGELEEIYPMASKKSKEKDADGNLVNKDFADRAHDATRRLQSGDAECRKVWEQIMKVSIEDLKKNYGNLQVHFDLWKGESDAQKYIPGLIDDLIKQGLAYESEGALVVDIAMEGDKKELPPCMVRKSDGAALYATSDLGTIIEREKLFKPNEYIYIADSRQSLHYTSFFRVARKAGYVGKDTELKYIGFGTMNGKDGKPFKTREGGVLRLEALINETRDKVLSRMLETRKDISDEEAKKTAEIIALAALKYGDLSNQATKDYIFDLDKFTSFEGNTGPYILYTMVRILSILRKYVEQEDIKHEDMKSFINEKSKDFNILAIDNKNGRALELLLSRYQEVLSQAWEELAPHKICSYIYDVSNAFNSFYHDVKFLAEEDEKKKESYLGLLMLTYKILLDAIEVLGFESAERM